MSRNVAAFSYCTKVFLCVSKWPKRCQLKKKLRTTQPQPQFYRFLYKEESVYIITQYIVRLLLEKIYFESIHIRQSLFLN